MFYAKVSMKRQVSAKERNRKGYITSAWGIFGATKGTPDYPSGGVSWINLKTVL